MASDLIERLNHIGEPVCNCPTFEHCDGSCAPYLNGSGERTPRQIIGDDAFMQLVFEGWGVERAAEIASLRTALAMEGERAEKAERELRLKAGLVDEAVSAFKGHKAQLQAKLDSAEASLAEAKWLLKPFGQNPGASSLAKVYAHLTRQHAQDAARFLAQEEARPTEEPQR